MTDMEALLRRLPGFCVSELRTAGIDIQNRIEEIRFRKGLPMEIVSDGRRRLLGRALGAKQMDELLSALSGHALYGCEAQLAQGYLPLGGGHRAGVCGRMCRQPDGSWRLAEVFSMCIRLGRCIDGAGSGVYSQLLAENGNARSVLLLGPPGCGKTTVLRDCARYLAREAGLHVAVADEREELCIPGCNEDMDVLCGMDKAQALVLLIRSMAPQVIVTDEIGRTEDVQALLEAARCGVSVLASAHARSGEDVQRRPQLRALLDAGTFDRYVLLGKYGGVCGVWNADGIPQIWEKGEKHGDGECSADGDDSGERGRVFAR